MDNTDALNFATSFVSIRSSEDTSTEAGYEQSYTPDYDEMIDLLRSNPSLNINDLV